MCDGAWRPPCTPKAFVNSSQQLPPKWSGFCAQVNVCFFHADKHIRGLAICLNFSLTPVKTALTVISRGEGSHSCGIGNLKDKLEIFQRFKVIQEPLTESDGGHGVVRNGLLCLLINGSYLNMSIFFRMYLQSDSLLNQRRINTPNSSQISHHLNDFLPDTFYCPEQEKYSQVVLRVCWYSGSGVLIEI